MISIKKFLVGKEAESRDAFERMSQLLLQAIGLHAVEGDRADYDWFRCVIADLQSNLSRDSSSANVLVATGIAVTSLQDYNRRTSQFIHYKGVEMQGMVGMLTQAMSRVATTSLTSIARLQDLQKQVEHAAMVEDVRTLRLRLSECLESISGESERQRHESTQAVMEMKRELQKARERKPVQASGESDLVTGLPLRSDAEGSVRALCEAGAHAYAGLFVLDRLHAITSRFGQSLGDKVMIFFLQHLSQGLAAKDQLFRWSPVSYLALLHREDSPDQVRQEMGKFLSRRLEQTFDVGDRSVAVPVASTWVIVPLFESTYTQIVHKLDAFGEASSRC